MLWKGVWNPARERVRHTSNEPLNEDLEDGGNNQGVEQADGGVVDVPEAAHADGADEKDDKRNKEGQESSRPDGDNLVAEGVSELRVDDLAVPEGDWVGC